MQQAPGRGGFASLLGGLLAQARSPEKVVDALMRDGIGTTFLAGLLLATAHLRKERIPSGLWLGLLAPTVADIAVAIFGSPVHR